MKTTYCREIVLKSIEKIASQNYVALFISAGKTYLAALDGFETLLPADASFTISQESSGRKLTALKAWLNNPEKP